MTFLLANHWHHLLHQRTIWGVNNLVHALDFDQGPVKSVTSIHSSCSCDHPFRNHRIRDERSLSNHLTNHLLLQLKTLRFRQKVFAQGHLAYSIKAPGLHPISLRFWSGVLSTKTHQVQCCMRYRHAGSCLTADVWPFCPASKCVAETQAICRHPGEWVE